MIRELFLEDMSLWGCVWQSTSFALIGLVGSFLLRRRPARASQVLLLALIAAVTVPAMGVLVKHFELGVFVAEPIQSEVEMPHEFVPTVYETSVAVPPPADIVNEIRAGTEGPVLVEAGPARAHIPWRLIVLYGWMAVTLILLGRLSVDVVNGILLLRRAQSRVSGHIERAADSARARLGIAKALQIRSSVDVRSPVIWCWSPVPVLLVPADLDDGLDWVGVICHELAHWIRRDHISGLIAELIVCILPWNPLLWWSKKRMVRFSEQACDDWVVAGGQSVEDYAQSLLNFRPQKQIAFVPAVVSSKKTLAGRIRRIVEERCKSPYIGLRWSLTAAAIAGCIAVGIAFAQTRPSRPAGTVKTKVGRSAVIEQPAFPVTVIKGRILDPNNEAAYLASVVALPVTSFGAQADKEGYFELPWSPTWIEEGQSICFIATGRREKLGAVVEVSDPTLPVTIRLESAFSLEGKVVDPNGQRIAKCRVALSLPTEFKCQVPIFADVVWTTRARIFSPVPYGLKYKLTIQAEGYQARHLTVEATDRGKEVIDVGTITLQPQDPAKSVVAEHRPDPDLAKEFHDIYNLEAGEVLKFIRAPFVLGRQEYMLATPPYASFALVHGGYQYGFHWDGELKVYSAYATVSPRLYWVLWLVLGLKEYDFEIPKGLNVRLPYGDWIVRSELPMAEQLRALEEILHAELNRAIHFEKRTVEREVIVASGRYEFKPHPSGNHPDYIPFTWDGKLLDRERTFDSLAELLRYLESQTEIKVADETESVENITIRYRSGGGHKLGWMTDPEQRREKLSVLLDNLAKTTSLQFKVERRPAQIWFVTETAGN